MVDFVGFSDGYRKQQETGERKRLELAKAFQEFQRQNPTANPMEFQAFIDSMAGGSNYLRGGMPSGDMLKAITDRADTRRANEDADRERGILEKNIQLQTSLEGAATGIMLGYQDPGDNGYELKDFNAMSDQLKERFPGVDFDKIGFDPTTMFTGDRRRSAIAARVAEYLPTITNLVQSSGGKEITAKQLSAMNVPPALIEPLITQASQLEDERRDVFARTRGLEISREAQEQIALGNTEVYAHLVETFGSENLPKKDSPLMKQYIADATTAANEAKNNRDRATLKLGRDLTNDMMANDGLRSSLFLDDRAQTEQAMLDFAKSEMTDADFEAVFKKKKADAQAEDMSGYVDNMIASLSVVQRKEITDARQGAKGKVTEIVANARTSNDAAVINRFGDPSKDKAPPQVGNGGRSAQLAAQSLAKKYAMTPSVLQAIENVFASVPADEPQTMTSIMAYVEADPAFQRAAKGNLLEDVLGRLEDDANNQYGRRSQQTYGEWYTDTQSRVESTMSSYKDKVATATAMFQDDPVKLVQALQAVASNLNASMEDAVSDWRSAEQSSKDFTGWRTPGSEAFDSDAVFGGGSGSLEQTMRLEGSEVLSELDLLIQDAKQRILANQTPTETGDGPLAQDEQVDAVADVENFMNNLDDQQKLMKIQTEFGKQGAPASWILGYFGFNDYTEMDRAKGKAISEFLQTPRVKNALKEDRESFKQFIEDPVVFMLESDAPYLVNWFNSDLGSTYAELIGRQ